jgi:hypothetical protein
MLIHKMPLLDVKVCVWCAMSAARIIEPFLFGDHKFTPISYALSVPRFSEHLTNYKKNYALFF